MGIFRYIRKRIMTDDCHMFSTPLYRFIAIMFLTTGMIIVSIIGFVLSAILSILFAAAFEIFSTTTWFIIMSTCIMVPGLILNLGYFLAHMRFDGHLPEIPGNYLGIFKWLDGYCYFINAKEFSANNDDMAYWCKINCKGYFNNPWSGVYVFMREQDAMSMKLAFH